MSTYFSETLITFPFSLLYNGCSRGIRSNDPSLWKSNRPDESKCSVVEEANLDCTQLEIYTHYQNNLNIPINCLVDEYDASVTATCTANISSYLLILTILSFYFQFIGESVIPIKCTNQNNIVCHEK